MGYKIFMIVILFLTVTVNDVVYTKSGVYVNVIPQAYSIYSVLDDISDGYIQVDTK